MDLFWSGLVLDETSPGPAAPALHPSGAELARPDVPKAPATRDPMARLDVPSSTNDGFECSGYMPRDAAIATDVQFRHSVLSIPS